MIEFTYSAYSELMNELTENGYSPIRFCDVSENISHPAIIRHDVDLDPVKAEEMAELESSLGIKSTYFVLLTSHYYNLFSKENVEAIKKIINMGHEVGLHFDITNYEEGISNIELKDAISKECQSLSLLLDIDVKSISWHIPKRELIGVHLDFMDELGLLNAYDPYFYDGFKYVSDSMMRWREPADEYIREKKFDKLQVLTHPIWYQDKQLESDVEILKKNFNVLISKEIEYLDTIKPGISDLF